jgi:hypothetical protein
VEALDNAKSQTWTVECRVDTLIGLGQPWIDPNEPTLHDEDTKLKALNDKNFEHELRHANTISICGY